MSKNGNEKKYCNCPVSKNKIILKSSINHSYCEKCGSVLLKSSSGKINYTIKQKQKIKPVEFDPVEIIKSMKKKTDAEYPYLNNEYNMSDIDQYNKEKLLKSINIYLKHRKSIILNLQKMMKMLDYSDLIFYQCLFYIDSYLSHNIDEEMSEKEVLYYLVGYFLCSAKSKETDIYEPTLDSFCYMKKKIYLSMEKIAYYEVICLQSIKYNVFSYSAYDWLSELNTIGYVFDCEINKSNEIILINGHRHSLINSIHKYAVKKLLSITVKDIFIKYSPMYIAFSLMKLAREKFIDKEIINQKLFNKLTNLYGVSYTDYKKCYKELKEVDDNQKENNENEEKEKENQKKEEENKDNINKKSLILGSSNKLIEIDDHSKIDKGVVVVNKMNSTNSLNRIKASLFKAKEEQNLKNDNNEKDDKNNKSISDKENSIDENIIVLDENNDEKADIKIEQNFDINIKNNSNEDKNKNKLKSSNNLSNIKLKGKEHISINCTNIFKSNDNLPQVDRFIDNSFQNQEKSNSKDKNKIKNSKFSSSKAINNHFLKSSLNPVKTRKSVVETSDTKNVFASFSSKNNNIYYKSKEELDQIRHSLFQDNLNSKNQNIATGIVVPPLNKMSSNNIIEEKSNNLMEERNNQNNKNNDNNRWTKYRSKGKSNNNLEGKETKTYVPNKRYQSTNQIKKKSIKTTLDAKNVQNNKNNIKVKNK